MSELALSPDPPKAVVPEADAPAGPQLPRIRQRFSWTLADQAASSGTNALISFGAAHSLSSHEFGSFALAFALAMVAVGITRAIASEPLMVNYSGVGDSRWYDATSACLSGALAIGIALGLLCAAVSLLAPDHLSTVALTLGLILPGLLVQDTVRYVCFAAGQPREALRCDLTWTALLVFPAIYLVWTDSTATQWLAVWGGSVTLTALSYVMFMRPELSFTRAIAWWLAHRSLGGPFAIEFLLSHGSLQVVAVGVGIIAGLSEVGSLRGASVILGPLQIMTIGAMCAALPHAATLRDRNPATLDRFVIGVSGGLALLMSLGFASLMIPDVLGEVLLGETWPGARRVLLPAVISFIAAGAATGAVAGLRTLRMPRASLRVRLISTPVVIGAGLSGAAVSGAQGAMTGLAIAYLAVIPVWLQTYRSCNPTALVTE